MPHSYIEKINAARVYEVAFKTPLQYAKQLSHGLKNKIWMKREDMQPVFSFKLRGAYNKLVSLTEEQLRHGVIAASAGNHAQGLAMSAQKCGVQATIVMPKTTPPIKIKAVQSYGAHMVLFGDTYDEAYGHALSLAKEHHFTFIHPYDDPEVIAGQGTIAKEILEDYAGDIHAIFIPVGGGGLIAGMAAYIKQLRPEVKIIGVEPEDAPCLFEALRAGERVILDKVGIFADGVAVRQVGREPFRIAKTCVDDVILVSTDDICAAIKDIFEETRSITEPAGALAVAGIKKYIAREKSFGQTLVAINSGANVNFDRLRHISERADVGQHREALFAVSIPEVPGSFKAFCQTLGKRSVTEFNYRYSDAQVAHIFVGLELHKGLEEKETILLHLKDKGYSVIDMTENELAKLHVRYMVGGKNRFLSNEMLYRFEFPERPGALLQFLNGMQEKWNISLFHYRNHGAAYGRVLEGIQVPDDERELFRNFVEKLGYVASDETANPVFKLFL